MKPGNTLRMVQSNIQGIKIGHRRIFSAGITVPPPTAPGAFYTAVSGAGAEFVPNVTGVFGRVLRVLRPCIEPLRYGK